MKAKIVVSLFAVCGLTGVVVAGCGGGGTKSTMQNMMVDGNNTSTFASSMITLPTSGTEDAIDLNGDGRPDNQLGKIIGAVMAIGLMPQNAINSSVTSGEILILFDEVSTDATQQNAKNAGVKLSLGLKPASPPAYNGSDTFMVDTSNPPAQFYGNIVNGAFTANNPAKATTPVSLTVKLALVTGQPTIDLPVIGGYVALTNTGGNVSGTINGAVKQTDVDNTIIPAVATLLNAELQTCECSADMAGCDPGSDCTEIEAFDTNMDGMITASEVMNNTVIAGLIKADVQMYQNGVYDPSPANTTPDSLSLGFAFNAVKATGF